MTTNAGSAEETSALLANGQVVQPEEDNSKWTDIFDKYDSSFLQVLAVCYFNQGLKVLVVLAGAALFKNEYNIEPAKAQVLGTIVMLPWAFKLLYGIISDNYPIFGSKRRIYIIILSFLGGVSMLQISFYKGANYRYVTAMLCL